MATKTTGSGHVPCPLRRTRRTAGTLPIAPIRPMQYISLCKLTYIRDVITVLARVHAAITTRCTAGELAVRIISSLRPTHQAPTTFSLCTYTSRLSEATALQKRRYNITTRHSWVVIIIITNYCNCSATHRDLLREVVQRKLHLLCVLRYAE